MEICAAVVFTSQSRFTNEPCKKARMNIESLGVDNNVSIH